MPLNVDMGRVHAVSRSVGHVKESIKVGEGILWWRLPVGKGEVKGWEGPRDARLWQVSSEHLMTIRKNQSLVVSRCRLSTLLHVA